MTTCCKTLEDIITLNVYPIETVSDICIQFNCSFNLITNKSIATDIGWCRIVILDLDKLIYNFNSNETANDLSKHTIYILKDVLSQQIDTNTLAIIDFITIEEEFRGRGFGSNFLDSINDYLANLNIGINTVGLISGFKNKNNSKVDRFYFSNGFKSYSTIKDNRKVMIKKLS